MPPLDRDDALAPAAPADFDDALRMGSPNGIVFHNPGNAADPRPCGGRVVNEQHADM